MDEFEQFWKAYPRKIAKGAARRAWIKTSTLRPPVEKLLKAIIVAKASEQWLKEGGAFIPYPATWLNQERWEDCHDIDLAGVVNGKMWWETNTGLESKAKELGITLEEHGYDWQKFKHSVFRAAGVSPIKKTA